MKTTDFWKSGVIFLNEKQKNDVSKVKSLSEMNVTKTFKFNMLTGDVRDIQFSRALKRSVK